MPSINDQIYAHSPVWLQNLGMSLYGYQWRNRRYGGAFDQYVKDFKSREAYSLAEWQAYQVVELRKLLSQAVKHVPYYRRTILPRLGSDFTNFELSHLSELPILKKNTLRIASDDFTSEATAPHDLTVFHTSGTTGTPLAIKFSKDMHRLWSASYETRVRNWAGVNYKMSRAMIGGRLVMPRANSKPPFWRYNFAERQLYMSAFHISPKNAIHYVKALNYYKPDYLVGYASSHFFLARMIVEQNLKVIQPKAVLTSSEKLTSEMRLIIEQAYGCQVYDAYSGVEACCLTSECEHHRMHVSPDVGIIELIDDDGYPVKSGVQGEIVATGLLNFDQPLIRYRTGDLAIWSDEPCPCGRNMPVLHELVGRLEDTVIGADGREIVRFHGIFVGLPHVREGQVIQETLKNFRLRMVVDPAFDEHDREVIRQRFSQRLGNIQLVFEYVTEIPRDKSSKFRAVISNVHRNSVSSESNI